LAIQWYFRKDGAEHGPVTSDDLRMLASLRMLLPTDSVRKAEMTRWAPASALKGLFPATTSPTRNSPVSAPTPSVPVQQVAEPHRLPNAADPQPMESNGLSKWILYLTATAAVLAAAGGVYRFVRQPAESSAIAHPSEPINPPATEPILASETIDPLILAISSQSPFDRGMALRQLKYTAVTPKLRTQVHQLICDTLDDRAFSSIWSSAARALGEVGSPDDLPRLKPLIDQAPVETQCAAIATSMVLDPQTGIKFFEPRAADDKYGSATAAYLADCGQRCEPVALVMLKSPVPMCRYYALYLLKEFGTAKALEAIGKAKQAEPDKLIADGYQFTIDAINSRNQ
jgi:hypothetical protein